MGFGLLCNPDLGLPGLRGGWVQASQPLAATRLPQAVVASLLRVQGHTDLETPPAILLGILAQESCDQSEVQGSCLGWGPWP